MSAIDSPARYRLFQAPVYALLWSPGCDRVHGGVVDEDRLSKLAGVPEGRDAVERRVARRPPSSFGMEVLLRS